MVHAYLVQRVLATLSFSTEDSTGDPVTYVSEESCTTSAVTACEDWPGGGEVAPQPRLHAGRQCRQCGGGAQRQG